MAGYSKHLGGAGSGQTYLLATLLFETTVSCVAHISDILVPIILALCLCTAQNSGIILAKIVVYYS